MTEIFRRLDVFDSELSKVETTDEGYAHFYARATRTGVFKYRNKDGSIRRELRHPDEVFSTDSMKTLENKPVTNDHPSNLLDTENTREYIVGVTGSEVKKDGIYLKTKAIIMDKSAINDIIKKGKIQVSCGYNCEHDLTPGTYNGEPYDLIQRNIRYNHLAVVDAGRAGPEVKIRLDSQDAIMVEDEGVIMETKIDLLSNNDIRDSLLNLIREQNKKNYIYFRDIIGNDVIYESQAMSGTPGLNTTADVGLFKQEFKILDDKVELVGNIKKVQEVTSFKVLDQLRAYQKEDKKMAQITIDGVDQEVSEEFKKAFDAKSEKDSDKFKTDSAAKISELQAQVDSLKEKVSKEDEATKKANSDAEINKRVNTRLSLYDAAKSHCDESITEKLDSMSDMDIKIAVIKSLKHDSVRLDEKDEYYINARFDIVLEDISEKKDSEKDNALGTTILNNRVTNSDGKGKEDPRMSNWKNPSSMSKKQAVKV